MTPMRVIGFALVLATSFSPALAGQAAVPATPAAQVDVSAQGPQPGARVPDFTLPDQDGRPRTLASLAGPRGTMLVFSRSADW
jgi:cytochrome oxidase Cu insertion factor (SCO1/SenC/PrrC family)